MSIMAVDPGRDKCGIAVLKEDGVPHFYGVIRTETLGQTARELYKKYAPETLVLGNGTTSKAAQKKLSIALPEIVIKVRDEYKTTEEARKLYFRIHPPRGLKRLIPVSMQVPPEPVDGLVAVILASRELGIKL